MMVYTTVETESISDRQTEVGKLNDKVRNKETDQPTDSID